MTQEMEQFETHMDRMDRLSQQQKHELALAQEKTKQVKVAAKKDTKEAFMFTIGAILVAAVLLGIVAAIFLGARGPGATENLRHEEITMCMDHGGKWEPDKGDYRDDDFVAEHCNLPGDGE